MFAFPHQITIWAATGTDGFGGKTFSSPVSVAGRFEERAERFRTDSGDEIVSKAVIYLEQPVNVGDYVALGEHVDANPIADSREVRVTQVSPSLRGGEQLNKAIY